jgi:esterase/lipase superfamily enzyme
VLEGEVFDGSAAFFEAITRAVPDPNNYSVLLFVHGYNTAFEDAVRRTAQLTYDLDYPGVAITYSWPSLGSSIAYARDESNVDWTTPHLQKFLTAVAVRQGVRTINIIAHSLGNRAVAKALHNMVLSGEDVRFTNVVLAAPDVDRDIFIQLAPAIAQGAETVTLYASDHDRALNASKQINGYPRAGDCGNDIVVHPGIQTVDVSALDTDFMGHGYVAENTSVVSDLYWVLKGQPPPRFRLRPAISPSGPYWRFVP